MSTSDVDRDLQKGQLALQARTAVANSQFEQALSVYNRYIQLYPEDIHGYDGMATTLHFLQREEEERRVRQQELQVCERILQQNKNDVSLLHSKAYLLAYFNRYEEALRVYNEILLVDPTNWMAVHQLGTLLAQIGRADEAAPYLKKAQTLEEETRQRLKQRVQSTH
jgi:Flp pilus assembly protein TadD